MLETPERSSNIGLLVETGKSAGNQSIIKNISRILRDYMRYILNGWRYSPFILEIIYILYINITLFVVKFKQSLYLKSNSNFYFSNTLYSGGDPQEDPEDPKEDENDDRVENKSANNNNIVIVEPKHNMEKLHFFNKENLKSKPLFIYNSRRLTFVWDQPKDSLLKDKDLILSSHKSISGIYLLHNLVNGKQYVGSAYDLRKRLSTYYFPSRLIDNRYISNSLLKYGHDSFSLAILDILGSKDSQSKSDILFKEQLFIDLYKPLLNINPSARSSLGFKHSEESKKLIAEFRKGKPLSEQTKSRLSILLSGELNPFWSKKHSPETIVNMSKSKLGELNPMFNIPKSKAFIEQMYKDKFGDNNPMFGKQKSPETLAKLSKRVYVYDGNTKEFIKCYDSFKIAVKDLRISHETIRKYIDTHKVYKEKVYYSELQ